MAAGKSAGGGSSAVRAGRAFVELFTSDVKLVRGLEQAKKKLESWGKTIAKVSLAAGAAGGGILAPMTKLFTDAVSRSADLDTLAKKFGETTEDVSTLATGFEKAGIGLEGFGGYLDGMSAKIAAAATANAPLIDGLQSMQAELNGVSMMGMTMNQQLDVIAEAVRRATSDLDKANIARDFGISELLPLLKKGKAGMDEMRQSGKLGMITTEQGEQAKKIMTAYTDAIQSVKYAALEVGMALFGSAGDVSSMSDKIKEGSKAAGDWIRDNKELIVMAVKLGVGLIAAGVALSLFASLLGALGTVAGVAVTILTGLATVIAFAFSPAGLLLAGLAAGVVGFAELTETGREATNALTDGSEEFAHTMKTGWASVVSAVSRGDLEGAFAVITASMEYAWSHVMAKMTAAWVEFKRATMPTVEGGRNILARSALGWGRMLGILTTEEMREMGRNVDSASANVTADREADNIRQIEDANKALADAKKKLGEVLGKEVVKEAEFQKKKREAAAKKPGDKPAGPSVPSPKEIGKLANDARNLFQSSKGIFSGPVLQQLGYGDSTAERQLDAQKKIEKNTEVLPDVLKGIQNFNNPRFK